MWLTVPIVLGLFFGGGYVGARLSRALAPDSDVAEFVSFFTLPVAFAAGTIGWVVLAVPSALRRLVQLVRAGKGSAPGSRERVIFGWRKTLLTDRMPCRTR